MYFDIINLYKNIFFTIVSRTKRSATVINPNKDHYQQGEQGMVINNLGGVGRPCKNYQKVLFSSE